jgi:hypothetical protein
MREVMLQRNIVPRGGEQACSGGRIVRLGLI